MWAFEVPGPPIAKGRARIFTVKSRSGAVFHRGVTPKRTSDYESWVRTSFLAAMSPDFRPLDGALWLEVRVFEAIPESFSKLRRKMAIEGSAFPLKKPDVDNYLKSFADALTGLAFHDDKQLVRATVSKSYDVYPRAVVRFGSVFEAPGGGV